MVHGSRAGYARHGCRCELCREAQQQYQREYRRRKRVLQTVAPLPDVALGPCVLAVRADVAAWGVESQHVLVAVAEAMARILDDRRLATTQPSAAGKLLQIMAELRGNAAPRRLSVVQEMSKPSRPAG
jgi:hypothetical protein